MQVYLIPRRALKIERLPGGYGYEETRSDRNLFAPAPVSWSAEPPRTEITKWQDGKQACVSITYDDSSINQFRIAVPLMNERHLPGTFFVVTGGIQGSKNQPTFVGRPIMNIIRESESVPTTKENLLERTSMLNYLQTAQRVPELKGFKAQRLARFIQQGNVAEVAKVIDPLLATLRQTGATYAARPGKSVAGARRNAVTWMSCGGTPTRGTRSPTIPSAIPSCRRWTKPTSSTRSRRPRKTFWSRWPETHIFDRNTVRHR